MNNDTANDQSIDVSARGITELLAAPDPHRPENLYRQARDICAAHCGNAVILRGIVEFSNYCRNGCAYCGLRRQNGELRRYRLDTAGILAAVDGLCRQGVGTVVLQSGEDPQLDPDWLASLIERIKRQFDVAVTLSVGEWPSAWYRTWRSAGADRYLLKIETSDPALYNALHPGMDHGERLRCLDDLAALGYQSGSGIIVGLPGQTAASIARDLLFLQARDFDMISVGPFIPHPKTPLASVPQGSIETTCRAIAVTRCLTKNAHIPATSALAASAPDQRYRALLSGANVIMPNFTPSSTARYYDIYPHAGRKTVHGSQALALAVEQILKAGRSAAYFERGDSLKKKQESFHDQDT